MAKEYDIPSEAESSDTLPSQRIYTPTSSTTGGMTVSDEQEAEHIPEDVPLLYDQPPTYADAACGDEDEKAPLSDISAKEVEAGEQKVVPEPERPCRRGRCRRGRCMRVCLLVSIKMVLLVGSLGFLMLFFGGFGPHFSLSRYRPCHWRWHPTSTGISKSNPREITVDHGHRSIWGKYPLYDQLSLSTSSGNIGVTVIPQPADPENPDEPARLRIRSDSGSIAVSFSAPEAARLSEYELTNMEEVEKEMARLDHNEDTDEDKHRSRRSRKQKHKCKCKCKCKGNGKCKTKCKGKGKHGCDKDNDKHNHHHHHNPSNQTLPARPYIIDIESHTGSIFGRFIVSDSINLSSSTGSITATLIPIVYTNATDQNVTVQTHTRVGSQQIRLTEPIINIGKSDGSGSDDDRNPSPLSLSSLQSYPNSHASASHTSHTGSMHISYPRQWAGKVHAESEGSIFLGGKGLVVKGDDDDGVVDGRRERDEGENESGNWWGGNMDVSLESRLGAVSFFAG